MSWAIWIAGLPGSGKSALAREAARRLRAMGERVVILEIDKIRPVLTPSPTYTDAEHEVVYRALVYIATALTEAGIPVIVDATAYRRVWRSLARASIARFAEIQLVCPLDVRRKRERYRVAEPAPRNIYARAGRAGATVPGVDMPYEAALAPELTIDTTAADVPTAAAEIVDLALRVAPARPATPAPSAAGCGIWITGLPGSGKTTLARGVARALEGEDVPVAVLGLTAWTRGLWSRLHGSALEQEIAHRALVYAAKLVVEAGVSVLVDAAAPRRAWRELARGLVSRFAEVELVCPRGICADRERAARWNLGPSARAAVEGLIARLPDLGLDYERSLRPDLTLHTDVLDPSSVAREVLRLVHRLRRAAEANPVSREERTMRVRDLMTHTPITAPPDMPVLEARQLMHKKGIRHLLVTDGARLLGIVTDRDIRLNLPSPATSLSVWEINYLLARLAVDRVMSTPVITVDPERDAREAARLLIDHKIGALAVVEGGRLVGIITETDLLRAFVNSPVPVAV